MSAKDIILCKKTYRVSFTKSNFGCGINGGWRLSDDGVY